MRYRVAALELEHRIHGTMLSVSQGDRSVLFGSQSETNGDLNE